MVNQNTLCKICGATHFTPVEVRNSAGKLRIVSQERYDTGKIGPFGGPILRRKEFAVHARVCENCGHVTMLGTRKR